ncbi:hypothetical protein GCM10010406_45270 [Streptomyces thermolineatus]|uniref:DUF397 domain-containing protein n=1 Tax=Streptomyces thermolineatus TaxID=44033 RepID=A0ABP5ZUQ0_9ACTN
MNSGFAWFKSSYSDNEGGNCVEVAVAPGAVHVRDSKDRGGPSLAFAPDAWAAFTAFVADRQGAAGVPADS